MHISYNSLQRKKRLSATMQILIVTVILSLIEMILRWVAPSLQTFLANNFYLQASSVVSGQYLWSLVFHIFVHGGLFHLFVNMLSLFFIGSVTESIIGRKRFLWFYFISGIVAGVIYVLFALFGSATGYTSLFGDANQFAVGASGALFGLLGILAVLIPKKRIYLILGPIVIILLQSIVSSNLGGTTTGNVLLLILNILLLVSLFGMFSFNSKLRKISWPVEMPLWLAPIVAIVPLFILELLPGVDLPIGNTAHFGGLVAGLSYGLYLRLKYSRKIDVLQRYFR